MKNKQLNSLRVFTLKELLANFEKTKFVIEFNHEEKRRDYAISEQMFEYSPIDVLFKTGHAEVIMPLDAKLKIINKDEFKIIESYRENIIGMTVKFYKTSIVEWM